MFNPTARQLQLFKVIVFIAALIPLGRLVLFGFTDRLGANPIEFITRSTGDWTLYFIAITLAVTPLRRLSGWNWVLRLRRMIGLFAFFYATLHFMTFLWFDHFFDLAEMWKDVLKRPFITVGFTAFVLLIPLAATSTNGMLRRLGGKRWQALHRLVYLIAGLGILHFWWMKAGKNDFAQPILLGSIIGVLLLLRVYWKVTQPKGRKVPARPAAS
ncbi:sulfoxide reductase heme-binding subunit YedZ [Noviherbaspirillum humi]|uniref:Protein-methionine-sulfoxide reductase heme-binding subunit MsrQ n=1 Tax=Noviherbaspirillum humi TaxID=1688639 RepID=A0A239JFI4_9BURK|nr:protein-methionine-sulfoxide reductase heme-binding subunit MsrQ [Noviherbaspirillum humi]SNT04796.1 sulfoxide reductase heme-binding subunit YedZ [Noviherbaspirillum humi]